MEDILASIRRILNEDGAAGTPGTAAPDADPSSAAPPGDPAAPEPLLLTEDMMVSEPDDAAPPAPPPSVDTEPPVFVEDMPPSSIQAEAPPPSPEPATVAPEAIAEGLLAPAVAAAAAASVSQLLRAVSTERSAMVHRGGPSIEDVVREELRPLLKDWLDQHLPAMVERLVRAEIERVVGRALS
jgi:cell pole-organizing protein PopZ